MNYLKTAWYWLVFSSNDPQRVSLTVRGTLIGVMTAVTMVAGLANIAVPSELMTTLIDQAVALVQSLLMALSIAVSIIGLVRKIAMTFAGTNKVLQ